VVEEDVQLSSSSRPPRLSSSLRLLPGDRMTPSLLAMLRTLPSLTHRTEHIAISL
jgi:hypothetical protein